ncbi:hypothetical protein E4V99_01545 [Microbacterium sp. dk485]|uniref:glycosyltransferase n=1 Tax=Microbacterium sp. dk485 TaxID=2560021 RepID=UPI00107419FF|nr:glycosyltransferase [Microbacterium sp. dk485]TFV83800.1 hypothetical protein E4V99_01545 [Microbacterium sp. dk485]
MSDIANGRTALVLSYSDLATDPRVRREIDWLTSDGWTVDTLGLGAHPTEAVRDHFVLADPPRWTRGRIGALATHFLLPPRLRLRAQLTDRVPRELRRRIREGGYDLVAFNEYEFTPWVADRRDFTPAALRARLHLDLHEYRSPDVRRRTLGGRLTGGHYRWVRRHIGHPAFTSRTAVNAPIGKLYADEFGVPEPTPVRNAPPYVTGLEPTPVEGERIRMLFHGMPSWARGFHEILEAMRTLPEQFTMTFMLMPNPAALAKLEQEIAAHPARDRMRIVPPAPMRAIAEHINEYDLEIIFYRPLETNLMYALPNKFFEAAQGRLGVVVGETPTMAPLVREHGHGVVVPAFDAASLRDTLAALTAEDITRFKAAAARVAEIVNADSEGRAFLAAVHGGRA